MSIVRPKKVQKSQKGYMTNEKFQDYAEKQFEEIYNYLDNNADKILNRIVACNTTVKYFTNGEIYWDISNLHLNDRPTTVLLTAQSENTSMQYDFDYSTKDRLHIRLRDNITRNVRFGYLIII